jgi:hypothetical protein
MAVILDGASGGIQLTSTSGGTASVNPPATATSYVQTLPAATGTILNSASSLAAANLTGTVPTARLGSGTASSSTFLAGDQTYKTIASGGMTLLTTLNTTSGETITAGSLNLTGFKQLLMSFYSIGSSGTAGKLQMTPNGGSATVLYPVSSGTSSQAQYTLVVHDLGSGIFTAPTRVGMARNVTAVNGEGPGGIGINKGLTASTTTITFNYDGTETFNVGQILIYGIK